MSVDRIQAGREAMQSGKKTFEGLRDTTRHGFQALEHGGSAALSSIGAFQSLFKGDVMGFLKNGVRSGMDVLKAGRSGVEGVFSAAKTGWHAGKGLYNAGKYGVLAARDIGQSINAYRNRPRGGAGTP